MPPELRQAHPPRGRRRGPACAARPPRRPAPRRPRGRPRQAPCGGLRPASRDRPSLASGPHRRGRLTATGVSRAAEQARQLLHRLLSAPAHGVGLLAAERVLDDEQRQPGGAERCHLAHGEILEDGGPDEAGGRPALGHFQRVVETPRRAGSSVSRAGEDEITVLREPLDDLVGGGGGGIGLPPVHHRLDAEALLEERAHLLHQKVEVVLRIVYEPHGEAPEVARQRWHRQCRLAPLAHGSQDGDRGHRISSLASVVRSPWPPRKYAPRKPGCQGEYTAPMWILAPDVVTAWTGLLRALRTARTSAPRVFPAPQVSPAPQDIIVGPRVS